MVSCRQRPCPAFPSHLLFDTPKLGYRHQQSKPLFQSSRFATGKRRQIAGRKRLDRRMLHHARLRLVLPKGQQSPSLTADTTIKWLISRTHPTGIRTACYRHCRQKNLGEGKIAYAASTTSNSLARNGLRPPTKT